jgi:hypothetical protein
MPQAARIELADQLFSGESAVVDALNRRLRGGHATVVDCDGGEGQGPVTNPWTLNLAARAATKYMGIGKGLAHLGQAFVNADQPGVAEQKYELG